MGKIPKSIFSIFRILVLLIGFSIICLGAICISTTSSLCKCGNNMLVAYTLLPLGFFLLVTGIFWSTYHETSKHKNFFYNIIQRTPSHREIHIHTIDRPDFYPPSYENSIDPEKQIVSLPASSSVTEEEIYNIPPPLYTESSTEFIDESNYEEEQPPSYEVSVQQGEQQQQQQTGEHNSDTEGVSGTCQGPMPGTGY
ncbi:transmembrane protein 252 [Alligator sinensis]|uniref:Transmembrane protein 252 n=1 Tax=Alligator sinensis TaxID=38654 RepID=A0A1U7RRE4_ALLSI|nr:transmembrane protein 252 [Alligator sinensis]